MMRSDIVHVEELLSFFTIPQIGEELPTFLKIRNR